MIEPWNWFPHPAEFPEYLEGDKAEPRRDGVAARFSRHKPAMAGLVIFALFAALALFAPAVAPCDPNRVFPDFEAPPSGQHVLGTDPVGRDVLSRVIYGSRVSLAVGVGAVAAYLLIGLLVGTVAGYVGGGADGALMHLTDVVMSFPFFVVIMVMVSILGPGLGNVILALGLLGWPGVARIVRGCVLSAKESDYVKAGRALGYSGLRLVARHIYPNILGPILVNATFGVSNAILMESSLSFLGLGVRPPTASWGNMLTDAQSMAILANEPWLWLPPGLMIVVTVLSVNFVGDGLRDALDPKQVR
jgi:peptide/nickel transport system permease protein